MKWEAKWRDETDGQESMMEIYNYYIYIIIEVKSPNMPTYIIYVKSYYMCMWDMIKCDYVEDYVLHTLIVMNIMCMDSLDKTSLTVWNSRSVSEPMLESHLFSIYMGVVENETIISQL